MRTLYVHMGVRICVIHDGNIIRAYNSSVRRCKCVYVPVMTCKSLRRYHTVQLGRRKIDVCGRRVVYELEMAKMQPSDVHVYVE